MNPEPKSSDTPEHTASDNPGGWPHAGAEIERLFLQLGEMVESGPPDSLVRHDFVSALRSGFDLLTRWAQTPEKPELHAEAGFLLARLAVEIEKRVPGWCKTNPVFDSHYKRLSALRYWNEEEGTMRAFANAVVAEAVGWHAHFCDVLASRRRRYFNHPPPPAPEKPSLRAAASIRADQAEENRRYYQLPGAYGAPKEVSTPEELAEFCGSPVAFRRLVRMARRGFTSATASVWFERVLWPRMKELEEEFFDLSEIRNSATYKGEIQERGKAYIDRWKSALRKAVVQLAARPRGTLKGLERPA